MNWTDSLHIASREIQRNLGRAILTTLGVIIGVAAIISMVSIGTGAQNRIQKELENMGANNLSVLAGSGNRGGIHTGAGTKTTLKRSDADAMKGLPGVIAVSPVIRSNALARYMGSNWTTRIEGVSSDYLQVQNWKLASGGFITPGHVRIAANTCILGQTVVRQLFGITDPINKIIIINRIPCQVLGTLSEKGIASWGRDQDDIILLPITTVERKISGQQYLNYIVIQTRDTDTAWNTYGEIRRLLRQRHHILIGEGDDFRIRSKAELAKTSEESARVFTWLLGSIATISLLVGGIGIMNIMLVSVTERTHEIGIRRALGARRKDILFQFLIESAVLSGVGGMIGVLTGITTSIAIARFSEMPTIVTSLSVGVAFIFSTMVGVAFGLYPARKAANLRPIDALRYE